MNAVMSGAGDAVRQLTTVFLDRVHGNLIDGEWVAAVSGRTLEVVNPADGSILAHVAFADAVDVDAAVRAARRALEGPWSQLSHAQRSRLLFRLADVLEAHADELALLDTLDNGKPYRDAVGDVEFALEELREYAGWATKLYGEAVRTPLGDLHSYCVREPVGVAALITPWNFPLPLAVSKVAAALAAGCTAILKPAEQTPLSALRLGELALEAGVPRGVLNVLTGDGSTGAALVEHPRVDKVSFTGSTEVGKSIIRAGADTLKRVTLELGGKSPVIIFPDADLDRAVAGVAGGIFGNSGQVCVANSRLYAHRDVFDDVVAGVARRARAIRIGPGTDPASEMGPLVSQEQLDRVSSYIESGIADGARPVTGGNRIGDSGYFLEPTVLVGTSSDMRLVREEIFGPVLAAASFEDADLRAIAAEANDTPYGLAAYVWTRDVGIAHKMAALLKAGCIGINGGFPLGLPFGGYKQSGLGREGGRIGVEAYTELKSVAIQL